MVSSPLWTRSWGGLGISDVGYPVFKGDIFCMLGEHRPSLALGHRSAFLYNGFARRIVCTLSEPSSSGSHCERTKGQILPVSTSSYTSNGIGRRGSYSCKRKRLDVIVWNQHRSAQIGYREYENALCTEIRPFVYQKMETDTEGIESVEKTR